MKQILLNRMTLFKSTFYNNNKEDNNIIEQSYKKVEDGDNDNNQNDNYEENIELEDKVTHILLIEIY